MPKMKRYGAIAVSLILVAVLIVCCTCSSGGTPDGETGYLRFLLSDDASEVVAINDFESVIITVSGIGFQQGDESGNWTVPENYVPWTGDLLDFIGTNATVIWDGYIDAGYYTEAFIYVSNVVGNLTPEAGDGQVDILIPSDKSQITMPEIPFTVEGGAIVDFVFDVIIIKSIESGQYLIMPQVAKSGPDQDYRVVDEDDSDGEIELKGTILAILDDIWTVSVGNEEWSVNVTEAETGGTPAIGLKAKIEGMIGENNIISASKVKVED
jgi:hypothetical protein